MKTNRLHFFKILKKASKPLKTLKKAMKVHDLNSEKKTRQDKTVNVLEKQLDFKQCKHCGKIK